MCSSERGLGGHEIKLYSYINVLMVQVATKQYFQYSELHFYTVHEITSV